MELLGGIQKRQQFLLQRPRQAQWCFLRNNGNEKIVNDVQPGDSGIEILKQNRNINSVINDTDKNIGPACADKEDAIKESKRQLTEKKVYTQLTQEAAD